MTHPPFPIEDFSGVVRAGAESWAFDFADRAHEIPNTVDTQFGIASGTKGLTALVAEAVLPLDLRARELLGDDLPLIDQRVTVEHLLTHTSGIGDYYDEDVHTGFEAHILAVPAHELETTEDYLRALAGRDQLRNDVDAALADLDALVLPTLPIPAPTVGAELVQVGPTKEPLRSVMLRLTQLFNITGHPAISIPCGLTRDGLPCGLQLVGARQQTEQLVRTTLACEAAIS